jgi:hypothetical protein
LVGIAKVFGQDGLDGRDMSVDQVKAWRLTGGVGGD